MSHDVSPSAARVAIRAGLGALVSASGVLILYLAPAPRRVSHPLFDWLYLLGAVVLLLLGFLIAYDATSAIEQGVSGGDWSSEELAPLRQIVNWSRFAAFLCILGYTVSLCVGDHRFAALQAGFWASFIVEMIFNRLYSVLKSKSKPPGTLRWTGMKPIHSDHWDGMNCPTS